MTTRALGVELPPWRRTRSRLTGPSTSSLTIWGVVEDPTRTSSRTGSATMKFINDGHWSVRLTRPDEDASCVEIESPTAAEGAICDGVYSWRMCSCPQHLRCATMHIGANLGITNSGWPLPNHVRRHLVSETLGLVSQRHCEHNRCGHSPCLNRFV